MKPSDSGVKHSTSLVDFLATLSWGGPAYPAYSGKCEDVGGAAAGAGAGDGGAASSTAATSSASSGASPASGAASSSASPAGAAAAATEGGAGTGTGPDWKTAPEHFRTAYDTLKKEHERFASFKDVEPDSLTAAHTFHQSLYTESMSLADELGYDDAETVTAFHKDPVKLLNFLRAAKAEADAGGPADAGKGEGDAADPTKVVEKLLNQRLKPFEQERATRMAESANNLFRTTVNDLIAADYKGEDALPPKLQQVLSNMVSDRLKTNPQAIHRLVNEGKTSDINKMYSEAKTALLDIFGEMSNYDKARVERAAKGKSGGKPPANAGGERKSSTGDESATPNRGRGRTKFDEVAERLITQPEKVNPRYAQK